jgi:hypothetical protein
MLFNQVVETSAVIPVWELSADQKVWIYIFQELEDKICVRGDYNV